MKSRLASAVLIMFCMSLVVSYAEAETVNEQTTSVKTVSSSDGQQAENCGTGCTKKKECKKSENKKSCEKSEKSENEQAGSNEKAGCSKSKSQCNKSKSSE